MAKKKASKSDRRLKNDHELAIDTWQCHKMNKEFVRSSDKVFEQFGWGCRWKDIPVGLLDNMAEAYEHMVAAKTQKEKEYVSSTFEGHAEGVWKTTPHSNYYEADSS